MRPTAPSGVNPRLTSARRSRFFAGAASNAQTIALGSDGSGRHEIDHNQILLPRKVALRLNGLLQNSGGWRRWDYNDSSRGALSLRVTPWKNTSVIVNYENGRMKAHVTRPLKAFDAPALGQAKGSNTQNDAAGTTASRALGINRNTAVGNIYVTSGNDATPFVLTTKNVANFRILESS